MVLKINPNNYAKKNRTELRNPNNRDVPKEASVDHQMPLPSSFLQRLINGKNAVPVCMMGGLAGMLPVQRRSSAMYLLQMYGSHFLHDTACEKKPTSGEAESINRRAIYLNLPDVASFDFAEGSSDLNSFIPRKTSICRPAISGYDEALLQDVHPAMMGQSDKAHSSKQKGAYGKGSLQITPCKAGILQRSELEMKEIKRRFNLIRDILNSLIPESNSIRSLSEDVKGIFSSEIFSCVFG